MTREEYDGGTVSDMAYSWFKFYGVDFLSDPKMLSLGAASRSCFLTLLCYASASSKRGVIEHLDEEQLMMQAGISPTSEEWEYTRGVLQKLENMGIIKNDNGVITVLNWDKRQDIQLTPYERVRRHREKKRDDNAMITTDKTRLDKNRKNTSSPRKRVQAKKEPVFTTLGADVVKAFEEVDPKNKRYYANKTQRAAADFLVSEYGLEKVLKVVAILPKTNSIPYSPTITSPYDLQEKWAKLEAILTKKKSEGANKGRGVEL